MNIVKYEAKYKNSFVLFNTDWIVDNFGNLEKEDIETFEKIEEELKTGAMIYFAIEDDVVLASMQWAIEHDAKRLFILSNTKLKPALHIYEKYGFKEIKLKDYGYTRGDIAFERLIE